LREEIHSLTLSTSHCSNYLELSEFTFLNCQVCQDILEGLAYNSSCKEEPIIKIEDDAGRSGERKVELRKNQYSRFVALRASVCPAEATLEHLEMARSHRCVVWLNKED
jgi:hypothetical protein